MPNLGAKTFQSQRIPNETQRRLDAMQEQVDKLAPPTPRQRQGFTVKAWRKQHPAAVPGGVQK